MAKPKVTVNPVANQYTGENERIIEFSDRKVGDGGLISLRRSQNDDRLMVSVYRCGPAVDVIVGRPDTDDLENWHAQRTALAMAQEGLRRVQLFAPYSDVAEAVSNIAYLIRQVEGRMPSPT